MSFLPENNNNKVACVLVLDASISMDTEIAQGFTRLDALNSGVQVFEKDIKDDILTRKSVDIAVIKVSDPKPEVILDWTLAENFTAPTLKTKGATPLAEALTKAITICEDKKRQYLAEGEDYYRPWIIVISDGLPTSNANDWKEAVELAQSTIKGKKAIIIGVAIDGCPVNKLTEISSQKVMELSSHSFKEFFIWLSNSIGVTSRSNNGEALFAPTEQYFAKDILNS